MVCICGSYAGQAPRPAAQRAASRAAPCAPQAPPVAHRSRQASTGRHQAAAANMRGRLRRQDRLSSTASPTSTGIAVTRPATSLDTVTTLAAIRASLMCTCVNRAASHGPPSQTATATSAADHDQSGPPCAAAPGRRRSQFAPRRASSAMAALRLYIIHFDHCSKSPIWPRCGSETFVAMRRSCREMPSRISARLAAEISSILPMRGHAASVRCSVLARLSFGGGPAFDQARAFEPVQQADQRRRLDPQAARQLDLRHLFIPRKFEQHVPPCLGQVEISKPEVKMPSPHARRRRQGTCESLQKLGLVGVGLHRFRFSSACK